MGNILFQSGPGAELSQSPYMYHRLIVVIVIRDSVLSTPTEAEKIEGRKLTGNHQKTG